MLTLAQLRTEVTRAEAEEYALTLLTDLGLNARSWQSGSWQLTITNLFVTVYAALTANIKTLAEIGFNELAVGDSLTAFSDSVYDNQRNEATRAQHTLRLTCGAVGGPYTITAGQYVVRETTTGNNLLYTALTGGTLNPSSTLNITAECQTAGVQGNVAIGSITDPVTPLVAVIVTNIDVGDGTSLVEAGTNEESDEDLRIRNTTKWAAQNLASPAEAYEYWVRVGSANITRVLVDDSNPRGSGTTNVYAAGATGVAALGDVADGQAELDKHLPETSDAKVIAAPSDVQAFVANVYITAADHDAAKETEIEQALLDYINSLAIGGKVLPPPDGDGVTGYVLLSEWKGAVTAVDGVVNIGSPSPSADVAVTVNEVATLLSAAISFTYYDV